MSPGRYKGGWFVGLTTLPPSCAATLNILRALTSCISKGLSRPVQQYLHLYHVTGLGDEVQIAGLPKSSDSTPPDFTLWGFMKQMAFFQHLTNYVTDLSKRITNAAAIATPDALCYT